MELPEKELREYYKGVAKSLIKDGVTGFTEEELTEKLLNDHPDNPFRPLSEAEILEILDKSDRQFKEGKYRPLQESIEEERRKRGF